MEDLINESYEFEQVDNNPLHTKYDFLSKGEKQIPKRIAIRKYPQPGLERYYNLGFGNIFIDKNGIESISDMSRDNNKNDKNKVLKTVFTCALDFLSTSPNSILTFFGNTSAKHRLYKMGLNNNLASIENYFIIKGGIIKDLKIIENLEDGKQPKSIIDIEKIEYQQYNPIKSVLYNFITFEIKDDFK
ncbi:hypothetical protein IRZ71_14085 [Flavobacterium sp. ANB]|uniref:DUF6934 family protein n=1 Tax=unclassified Flavobacterium TaxID=196869 RepID=UPI0012B7253D|nr:MULTISPECIES: hypothetical protein [unclassified Flavobacterium]MBF4517490.1 hypothetical protein [Flavobacterium sp. ANB]MTD72120.1 hypothetical protein [Flavobacterium sp. LC2016-13]